MVGIIVILGLFAGIHIFLEKRNWLNPGTIFMFYWGIVVFMANLRLYGMRETSDKAYLFVLVGVIAFYIGSLLAIKIKIKISTMKRSTLFLKSGVYETNYTFFNISCITVILYSLYRIKSIIVLLLNGYSWWAIRLMATSGEGGAGTLKGGNLSDIIYSFIVSPLIYLIVPTIISEILEGRKRKNSITLSIVATILYSIATVSRAIWVFAIVYVLCASILMKGRFKLTKDQKKVMKFVPIIVIILAFVINKITKMRNAESDLFTNAYAYISGCMPLLSIHVEEAISKIRTHGMLTMYGFLHPIFFVTNRLHILTYPKSFTNAKLVKDNLETFINLSPKISMNAYATLFYDFYIDFGWIGIVFGSFAFGFICMKAFNTYEERGDTRSLVVYLILFQYILFSVARIYTVYPTRALSFVWMIFMFKNINSSFAHG